MLIIFLKGVQCFYTVLYCLLTYQFHFFSAFKTYYVLMAWNPDPDKYELRVTLVQWLTHNHVLDLISRSHISLL